MSVKHRLKHMIQAILNPVKIIRLIGPDGIKRVVVLWRSPFKRKILGKFEVAREFAADSFLPDWKPVEFTTSNNFEKKNRIADDKKLIEIYVAVVKDMSIKYGVGAEQAKEASE